MVWPPTLVELKTRMGVELDDTRKDTQLTQNLDAAVSFVEGVRPKFRYDQTNPDQLDLPEPTAGIKLGTLMLASRWQDRTRSPDGMINMAELGAARVSSYDVDIDRQLGIGRFAKIGFA